MFWRQHNTQVMGGELSPETVRERLEAGEELQLVDVREPNEYARGHIPGARLIPLNQLQTRLGELDADKETVLICQSGYRSGMACQYLNSSGFERARNMRGGMSSWRGPVIRV